MMMMMIGLNVDAVMTDEIRSDTS